MKYWWLEKYKDFKIIQIPELTQDVNYFLTMPKNYDKKYQDLKNNNNNVYSEAQAIISVKTGLVKNIITISK